MKGSEVVEISDDELKMRPKDNPDQWPIVGPTFTFSSLNADVPEFVPGQPFQVPRKFHFRMQKKKKAIVVWIYNEWSK